MLKKTFLALAFITLASSAQAWVRGGTDTGIGTNINASNSIYVQTDIDAQPAAGMGINYHDKTLHNYQDPYLTNPRAYKSNENGEAALPPKPNGFIMGYERPPLYIVH